MSVTPNIFVPANKAQKAMYCYRNAFGGKRLSYTTISEQEDEILCVVIKSPLLNVHNSVDIRATKNFAERNGCNVLRDVGEDPLCPGVLVATVTDPFKFVWQLSNFVGGLGID
ncbi:unnamed protein product [Prunus armeniaca]|uniref:Uncharacterized protein n=1 Tax=Prunus armeniaca TaxID=36596 RepID=A0A6J5UZZ2_PRUAR|nr:unnamed protein product [Prunus armeniaca]CAB4311139.1 unnamed protein product [Prunus armeniaca]